MKLSNIEKTNLVELAQNKILEAIRENKLKEGDKLPSEIEFTEGLGVSRSVVREAISRLKMLGILHSKKKRGLVVSSPKLFSSIDTILRSSVINDETQNDLFEFRLMLELGLADFIFLRKTPEDLAELQNIVDEEISAKSKSAKITFDIRFHKKLYAIANNSLLNSFQAILESFFNKASEIENTDPNRVTHQDLIDSLSKESIDDFRVKMSQHLSVHIENVKK